MLGGGVRDTGVTFDRLPSHLGRVAILLVERRKPDRKDGNNNPAALGMEETNGISGRDLALQKRFPYKSKRFLFFDQSYYCIQVRSPSIYMFFNFWKLRKHWMTGPLSLFTVPQCRGRGTEARQACNTWILRWSYNLLQWNHGIHRSGFREYTDGGEKNLKNI